MASLDLYILTFNCGRSLINVDAFSSQLFNGLSKRRLPDLLVLSLQEIAPIPHSLVGGSFLVPYFARFHEAVEDASRKLAGTDGPVYTSIAAKNVGMTGMLVFARDPGCVQDMESGCVGVGVWDMGNKGAIGVRFSYSGIELTFVAAHLAAMESELTRRNQDWRDIVQRLVFSSTSQEREGHATSLSASSEDRPLLSISPQDASLYKSTSHLFLAGDLNYRTSVLSPSPTDHIDIFPQPDADPSAPNHVSNLYSTDQLNQERLAGRTCHGLIEAPINFPPTYKYDSKEPFLTPDEELRKWHWAKHRWPSWCDRILFLDVPSWVKKDHPTAQITPLTYSALPLFPTSDHRAVALSVEVPLIPIPKPAGEEGEDPRLHPPFDIDIDWKTKREQARRLEVIVGLGMYFTTTLEGAGIFAALIVGGIGAWYVLKALLFL